jgi:hypothetical protein
VALRACNVYVGTREGKAGGRVIELGANPLDSGVTRLTGGRESG